MAKEHWGTPGQDFKPEVCPPTSLTSAPASLHHNVLTLQILRSSFVLPDGSVVQVVDKIYTDLKAANFNKKTVGC